MRLPHRPPGFCPAPCLRGGDFSPAALKGSPPSPTTLNGVMFLPSPRALFLGKTCPLLSQSVTIPVSEALAKHVQ